MLAGQIIGFLHQTRAAAVNNAHLIPEFCGQQIQDINGKSVVCILGVGAVEGKPVSYPVEALLVIRFHKAPVVEGVEFVGFRVIP